MHAPAQFEADLPAPGHRVGTHQHLLAGGDARVGAAQVSRADAAALQQFVLVQPVIAEGLQHQGNRIQGGQVGVQHYAIPAG